MTQRAWKIIWLMGLLAGALTGCGIDTSSPPTAAPPALYAKGVPWSPPQADFSIGERGTLISPMGAIWRDSAHVSFSSKPHQFAWPAPLRVHVSSPLILTWVPAISPDTVSVYLFNRKAINTKGVPIRPPYKVCTVNRTYPQAKGCQLSSTGQLMMTNFVPTLSSAHPVKMIVSAMWVPEHPATWMLRSLNDHQARWMATLI